MTQKKAVAKKVTKQAKAPKAEKVAQRLTFDKLPPVGDLKLAENGIRTEEKNRYVTLEFTNGYVVRLQPCNVTNDGALKTRALLAAWFTKHLL